MMYDIKHSKYKGVLNNIVSHFMMSWNTYDYYKD